MSLSFDDPDDQPIVYGEEEENEETQPAIKKEEAPVLPKKKISGASKQLFLHNPKFWAIGIAVTAVLMIIISLILFIGSIGSFFLLPAEFGWGPKQKMNPIMIVIAHVVSAGTSFAGIIVGIIGILNACIVLFVKKQRLHWYSTVGYVFSWIILVLAQIFSVLCTLLFVPLPELTGIPESVMSNSWVLLAAKIGGGIVGSLIIALCDLFCLVWAAGELILFSKGEKKLIKK